MLEVTGPTTFSVTVPVTSKSVDSSVCHDYDDGFSVDDDVSSHLSSHDDDRVKASAENRSHDYMDHEVNGLLADTAYRFVYLSTLMVRGTVYLYMNVNNWIFRM